MKKTPAAIAACLILLLLGAAGCDPATGIRRIVMTDRPISTAATTAALVETVGADRFTYESVDQPWRLDDSKEKVEPPYDAYACEPTSSVWFRVAVGRTRSGRGVLELSRFRIGTKMSPEYVSETRAWMDRTYARLRDYVPDLPPPEDVDEFIVEPGNNRRAVAGRPVTP